MGETGEVKKKKTEGIVLILPALIAVLSGIATGVFLVDRLFFGDWGFTELFLCFFYVITGLFISVNIHEAGHLILGKLNGYKFVSYRVGFLTLNSENGKIKFSIMKNFGYMGLCAMIPQEKEIPRWKHLLYYSGGILFNILFGIALIVIKKAAKPQDLLNMSLTMISVFSILLGIVNLIPFFSGNNPSDGKIIWSIIFGNPFSKKLMKVNRLCSQFAAGKPLRELDVPSDFNIYQPDALDVTLLFYSYFKALDTDDDENRSKYIKKMKQWINYIPGQLFPHACYEICYNACIDGDREEAEEYYKKAEKVLKNDKDMNGLRVKAYYEYYVNKNINVAKFLCESALEVADRFPVRGQALIEEKLVKRLIDIMDNN